MKFRSCGDERRLLTQQALESFACKLVCRIRFTTHITNHSPASPAPLANFVHRDAEAVARRHSTAHHGRAIRADDDAMIRPPLGSKVERTRAHVSLQLGRTAEVRKAERFRVHRSASNKNGQATTSPAVPVEGRVHVDHQAIPQTASLQEIRMRERLTRCCAIVLVLTLYVVPSRGFTSEAAPRPSRGSRRRRAAAHLWSCSGSRRAGRRPRGPLASGPGGSSPEAPASPTPPRNP